MAQICSNRTAVGMTDDARSVPSCPNRLWISVDDTPRVWITHVLRPQPTKTMPSPMPIPDTNRTRSTAPDQPKARNVINDLMLIHVDGSPGLIGRVVPQSCAAKERANKAVCLLDARMRLLTAEPEKGAVTAEYAVVLVAATAFAAVLIAIVKSDVVKTLLTGLIKKALSVG